jgi:site-specific DNA-methyltransferase (adenine-specific)
MSLYITNEDNMELMKRYPDNYFDLAIVDPPYGVGGDSIHAGRISKGAGKLKNRALQMHSTSWDIAPNKEYFNELFRVSKNQIIWGGNYFALPRNRGFVVWDKLQPWPNFSAAEYAWISFDVPSKIFKFDNRTRDKIHPTQKPIVLYKYLLETFANQGDKILDTHLGSGSIAIACHDYGFELTACELDKDYYDKAMQRITKHTSQQNLFLNETI